VMAPEKRMGHLLDRLPEGGLFSEGEWQFSASAFPLERKALQQIEKLGHYLGKFLAAADSLYRRSLKGSAPEYIAQWLERGKPRDMIEMARHSAGDGVLPRLIRPDLLLTEKGFVLTEIDSLPGGSGTTAWMNQVYHEMGDAVAGQSTMADRLRRFYAGHDVVISEEASAYRPEFEWLYGPGQVHAAEAYRFQEKPVYRFFEGFDWPQLQSLRESWTPDVRMDSPLKVQLEEKMWLALFWLRPLEDHWRHELGGRYFSELKRVIPYTWLLEPVDLPPTAVLPGLGVHDWSEVKSFSKSQRDLVIKLSGFSPDAWGSRSVKIGSDMTADQWGDAVTTALNEAGTRPWVMQEFHKAKRVDHPVFDSKQEREENRTFRARICPFYLVDQGQSELLGIHVTLCPPDKKRIHGMEDAVIVPARLA
jgi:hypothetical protein